MVLTKIVNKYKIRIGKSVDDVIKFGFENNKFNHAIINTKI